jgi:hypothetical protein
MKELLQSQPEQIVQSLPRHTGSPGAEGAQLVATSTNTARINPFTERGIAALILHLLKTGDLLPASGKCEVIWSAECPLLANNGLPGHVASTSAPPPRADIRWPMSVIVPISSASSPKADVAAVGRESPKLTHFRRWMSAISMIEAQ